MTKRQTFGAWASQRWRWAFFQVRFEFVSVRFCCYAACDVWSLGITATEARDCFVQSLPRLVLQQQCVA